MSEIIIDKQAVAAAKVGMALWTKLLNQELDEILPGKYKGNFFVLGDQMISWKEFSTTLDKCSERYKQLEDMASALRNTSAMMGKLSRLNKRQQSSTQQMPTGDILLPASGTEPIPYQPVPNGLQGPSSSGSIDVVETASRYRWEREGVDAEKSLLRQSQIYVPPGIVFTTTPDGKIPCLRCKWFPAVFRQYWSSPGTVPAMPANCNCPRTADAAVLSSKYVSPVMFETLINLWSQFCGRPVSGLVRGLCEKLGIEYDAPFEDVPLEKDWYQAATTGIIHLHESQNSPQEEKTIDFREGENSILGSIHIVRQDRERWIATPTTCFRNGHMAGTVLCNAPFPKPYPLWNTDLIAQKADACIRISASLLDAYERQTSGTYNGFLYTSWFGGAETFSDTDWHTLGGRKVLYDWDGTDEDAQLALAVIDGLKKVDCLSISIIQEDPNKRNDPFRLDRDDRYFTVAEFQKQFGRKATGDAPCPVGAEDVKEAGGPSEDCSTKFLVPPLIIDSTIINLYADSGTLKSVLSLTIGFLVATGKSSIKHMTCLRPGPVLFWDGEGRKPDLTAKKRSLARGLKLDPEEEGRMKLIHRKVNVLTLEGRNEIDGELKLLTEKFPKSGGVRLLVLDNMTHMTGSGVGSDEAWDAFFDWLKSLNDKGTSAIYVGHVGREGKEKGSQRQEISTLTTWKISDCIKKRKEGDTDSPSQEPKEEIELMIEKPGDNPYLKKKEMIYFSYYYLPKRKGEIAYWESAGFQELVKRTMANQKTYSWSDEHLGDFWGMDRKKAERVRKCLGISYKGDIETPKK